VNVSHLFGVFLDAAQGSVEELGLPEFAVGAPALVGRVIELCFTDFMAGEIVTGDTGARMQCQWSGRKSQAVR